MRFKIGLVPVIVCFIVIGMGAPVAHADNQSAPESFLTQGFSADDFLLTGAPLPPSFQLVTRRNPPVPRRHKGVKARKRGAERRAADRHAMDDGPLGEQYNFEIRGAYWSANLDSTIREDKGNLKGTEINLSQDLGLSKSKGIPTVELTLKFLRRNKIRFSYLNISYDAGATLANQMTFKGIIYTVNTPVNSHLAVTSTRLGYELDLVTGPDGFFGLGLSADFLQAEASIVTNNILSNKASASVVVPTVSGIGRLNFNRYFSGTAQLAWMSYDKSDLFDGSVYLDYNPLKNLGLTAGWRIISANAQTADTKIKVQWNGIFAGVALRL